jgi:hypothetical protein
MLTTFAIMNVNIEEKNLPMNQVNLTNRVTIDALGNFRNRNFSSFVKPKQSNPAIAPTDNVAMNDQDITFKTRTTTRRVEIRKKVWILIE